MSYRNELHPSINGDYGGGCISTQYDTRSEDVGICGHDTIKQALEAAEKDESFWKVSFNSAAGERIRLIKHDLGHWILELL